MSRAETPTGISMSVVMPELERPNPRPRCVKIPTGIGIDGRAGSLYAGDESPKSMEDGCALRPHPSSPPHHSAARVRLHPAGVVLRDDLHPCAAAALRRTGAAPDRRRAVARLVLRGGAGGPRGARCDRCVGGDAESHPWGDRYHSPITPSVSRPLAVPTGAAGEARTSHGEAQPPHTTLGAAPRIDDIVDDIAVGIGGGDDTDDGAAAPPPRANAAPARAGTALYRRQPSTLGRGSQPPRRPPGAHEPEGLSLWA